jgi:uncharacterized protein involved in exopolysaccharide biosynthesis
LSEIAISVPQHPPATLRQFLIRLWGARYLILAGGVVGAVVAAFVASKTTPAYEATTTVIVRQATALSPTVATNSMRAVIANYAVAKNVVTRLNLPESPAGFLAHSLRIEDVPGTFLMRVVVRLSDGALAAQAANATATEAIALNTRLTKTGGDRLERVMQDELATARTHMDEAAAAVREFKLRRRSGHTPDAQEQEIERARLYAEYDLATTLYEEIAVQFGKLRLQVAEQSAELLVVEEAFQPERSEGLSVPANALFGAVTGLTLALLVSAIVAFLQTPAARV